MYQVILPNGMVVPFSPQNIPGAPGHPMPHMMPPGAVGAAFSGQHSLGGSFSQPHMPGQPYTDRPPLMTGMEKTIEDAAALLPPCLALLLNPKYLVGVSARLRVSAVAGSPAACGAPCNL